MISRESPTEGHGCGQVNRVYVSSSNAKHSTGQKGVPKGRGYRLLGYKGSCEATISRHEIVWVEASGDLDEIFHELVEAYKSTDLVSCQLEGGERFNPIGFTSYANSVAPATDTPALVTPGICAPRASHPVPW